MSKPDPKRWRARALKVQLQNNDLLTILSDLEKWWAAHHPDSMPTVRLQVRAALQKGAYMNKESK